MAGPSGSKRHGGDPKRDRPDREHVGPGAPRNLTTKRHGGGPKLGAEHAQCPEVLTFRSQTTLARNEMGDYHRTDNVGGLPAYQRTAFGSDEAPFVYFYWEFSNWRVGYDYDKPGSVLTSGQTDAHCPSDVDKWYHWKNGHWDEVSDLALTEGATSVSPTTTTNQGPDSSPSFRSTTTSAELPEAELSSSSSLPAGPQKYSYDDVADGGCQDAGGQRMDSYFIASVHMNADFCQSHCDSDVDCVAYTSAPGHCTVWGPNESAQMIGWTFQEGDGATNVTEGDGATNVSPGQNSSHRFVETDAGVSCMVKGDPATGGGGIGGGGIDFWVPVVAVIFLVFWVLICCALIVAVIFRQLGGMKSKPAAQERRALAHLEPPLGGADEGTQEPFATREATWYTSRHNKIFPPWADMSAAVM